MNKELKLDKLNEYDREELEFFVKMLAVKLEKRTEELNMLRAKVSGRIGHGAQRNPNVK